ncbi:MAG TPA: ABC transporter ATP-binding protein [Thermoleophilaceae bacterium]|nr:ABC transporter ATP-binding protein [Thermoleophilaceae bacterium]
MIRLDGLVKHYSSGADEVVRALDGVSMVISPGELVALYGPSGSGKTTLLNVIAALIPPDSGTVLVGGEDVAAFSAREAARYRRTALGYVNQTPDLLSGVPAIANAALKLYGICRVREAHRQITPLMERLGLGDRLRHRPDELSAGERQRVLIARALSTEPRLVLADEPTGALDSQRSKDVLTLLTDVCREQDAAMLLVTHDPQAAVFASRMHALRDGRLEPYDPAREMLLAGP